MKIRLHSQHDHFPNHTAKPDEEADLEIWNDGKIWELIQMEQQHASVLLIEPRSLQPETYKLVEKYYYRFDNIFTHDSQLIRTLPNARSIFYWNEYEIHDEEKTKDISFICGSKRMCPLHNLRIELAEVLQDKIDILGDWNGGPRCTRAEAFAPYRFAVVIENYIDEYWFTEKILDAFGSKTVPIYLGASKIGDIFNTGGILRADNLWDIPEIIDDLKTFGIEEAYENMREEIEINFKRAQWHKNFEDYFITRCERRWNI